MPLVLRQRTVGPITLLELSERLTIENVPELRDKLQDLTVEGHRFFLLDCSQISVIDSQGIGGLVRNWWNRWRNGRWTTVHRCEYHASCVAGRNVLGDAATPFVLFTDSHFTVGLTMFR